MVLLVEYLTQWINKVLYLLDLGLNIMVILILDKSYIHLSWIICLSNNSSWAKCTVLVRLRPTKIWLRKALSIINCLMVFGLLNLRWGLISTLMELLSKDKAFQITWWQLEVCNKKRIGELNFQVLAIEKKDQCHRPNNHLILEQKHRWELMWKIILKIKQSLQVLMKAYNYH